MTDNPLVKYGALALIALLAFYLIIYKPKAKEIENVREERIAVENEVRNLRQKKKELDSLQSEVQTMTATLKELELVIPQSEEISDILRQIQELAYASKVNILKFIPQKIVEKEFYSEKPILIELTGSYHNLGRFYDSLSQFSRLFNVEDFKIKSLQKQSEGLSIAVDSTAKTYILPDSVEEEAPEKTSKPKLKTANRRTPLKKSK